MFEKKITIFTPTYNRAYIIHNLYHSLQRQTFLDFEWLVVDDGSTDNTNELFAQWIENEKLFDIRYYKTQNGGKHRAVNYGLDLARGEWFMVVDSDDYLTDDALDKIQKWIRDIEGQVQIVGVAANKGYSTVGTVNTFFKSPYLDKSLLEMSTYQEEEKFVIAGERALCFYTDFHRKYKYPEYDNENFMTEAVVYNRMAQDGYKMRFYNDIIWIFEYKEDGLTKAGSTNFLNNPHGYGLWLREKAEFTRMSLVERLKMYYTFTCDLCGRYDIKTIAECIGTCNLTIRFMQWIHRCIRCKKIVDNFKQRKSLL